MTSLSLRRSCLTAARDVECQEHGRHPKPVEIGRGEREESHSDGEREERDAGGGDDVEAIGLVVNHLGVREDNGQQTSSDNGLGNPLIHASTFGHESDFVVRP